MCIRQRAEHELFASDLMESASVWESAEYKKGRSSRVTAASIPSRAGPWYTTPTNKVRFPDPTLADRAGRRETRRLPVRESAWVVFFHRADQSHVRQYR